MVLLLGRGRTGRRRTGIRMGEGEGFEVVFVGLAEGENVSRCMEE